MSGIQNNLSTPSTQAQTQTTQTSYSEQLKNRGVNAGHIRLLDELDGNDKDGIQSSVFDVACAFLDGMSREDAVEKYGEPLCSAVGQVFSITDEDPTHGLPMYIKPEDAMRDLGISAEQAGELAKLGNSGNPKGIQRGFYLIAEAIVSGRVIEDPSGMMQSRVETVQKILQPDIE